MRFLLVVKPLIFLIGGISALVFAVTGHVLRSTYFGWEWAAVPVSIYGRLLAGAGGLILIGIGGILIHKLK